MDISVLIYAVIALAGVAIGWLISSYQHAQQKADQLAEREEIVAELSAAKQQLALVITGERSASYSTTSCAT